MARDLDNFRRNPLEETATGRVSIDLSQSVFESSLHDRMPVKTDMRKSPVSEREPEKFNVLDPRRYMPEQWNSSHEADFLLEGLPTKKRANNSIDDLLDAQGNLRFDSNVSGKHGDRYHASLSADKLKDIVALQLLCFSVSSVSDREFPQTVKDIAKQFRFNDDCMRTIELAEKIKDSSVRKSLQLAVMEQQLRQYDKSYLQMALQEVRNLDMKPKTVDQARALVDQLLEETREKNKTSGIDQKSQQVLEKRPGLTESEQQELLRHCSNLFTRDEFLWNVGRSKFSWKASFS
jgi:hypothetical protein